MKVIIVLIMLSLVCTFKEEARAFQISKSKISLSLKNQSISELVEKVHYKTGYTIVFPQNFQTMKVNGEFNDVTLDQLMARVLKSLNYSLVINEEQGLVLVNLFDSSSGVNKFDGSEDIAMDSNSPESYYAELARIAEENKKAFQKFINDPNSVDPRTGLSLKETRERAALGELAIKEFVNDDKSVDPVSGKPISDVREASSQSEEKFMTFLSDSNSKHPFTGRTIQEFRAIALERQAELDNHDVKF